MLNSLHSVHQVAACQAAGRGASAAAVVSIVATHLLVGNLGGLRNGEFTLATIRTADDVCQGDAVAVGVQGRRESGSVQMRLHGRQSRRRVVVQRQITQARQLVARVGAKTRGVSRSSDGRVVGGGR